MPWYEPAPYQLLGEATVVGALLSSVLPRKRILLLDLWGVLTWTHKHFLNLMTWGAPLLLAARILWTSEAGGGLIPISLKTTSDIPSEPKRILTVEPFHPPP